jgi:hypothetical protein
MLFGHLVHLVADILLVGVGALEPIPLGRKYCKVASLPFGF